MGQFAADPARSLVYISVLATREILKWERGKRYGVAAPSGARQV